MTTWWRKPISRRAAVLILIALSVLDYLDVAEKYILPHLATVAHSEGPNAADVALLLGGEPWREGLEDVPVLLVEDNPWGLLGLACDHRFEAVPGNAQSLCPEGYQGIVIYPPALKSVAGLLNMLRHEDYHLTEPVHESVDPFDEAGAYRAGCDYSYVDSCPWWLEHHPEVP